MSELPEKEPFTITVGPASFECSHGRVTTAINEPDRASGTVAADDLAGSPADWGAPARVTIGDHLMTSGEVIEALPDADGSVALSLQSALALRDTLMPPFVTQNLTPQENVYAVARVAGFATRIHQLAEVTSVEPMWVLAPISGVRVEGAMHVGAVELLDAQAGRDILRRFSPPLDPVFTEPLSEASAFARVAVAASLLYEAEAEGLALIDTAVAWLTTRLRYSWSHGPDGELQHYERAPTRVTVERRDGVGVLAVDGPRRSWRQSTGVLAAGEVALRPGTRWTEPAMPDKVPPGDRQALLALQTAVTASDPVQRVGALWEAIEFYVGERGPAQFTADEIAVIVDRASDGLAGAKAERVGNVLRQWLKQLPTRARLKHVLAEDGVPVTDDELRLLGRLREERNRAVHGGSAAPAHDEIDRAVAVMSRAMTTRWHRG